MARTRYYVGQYGYFWSFSREQLIAFFKDAIVNEGYHLPKELELDHRPRGIHRNGGGGGYWSSMTGTSGRYYEPLDWTPEDFTAALEALDQETTDAAA